jgi:hypothetical protein
VNASCAIVFERSLLSRSQRQPIDSPLLPKPKLTRSPERKLFEAVLTSNLVRSLRGFNFDRLIVNQSVPRFHFSRVRGVRVARACLSTGVAGRGTEVEVGVCSPPSAAASPAIPPDRQPFRTCGVSGGFDTEGPIDAESTASLTDPGDLIDQASRRSIGLKMAEDFTMAPFLPKKIIRQSEEGSLFAKMETLRASSQSTEVSLTRLCQDVPLLKAPTPDFPGGFAHRL